MQIQSFFDQATSTFTHLIWDSATGDAAVIDPVLDFDYKSGSTGTASADAVIAALDAHGLKLHYIFETHAHADHVSSAPYLKAQRGGKVVIGRHITTVQAVFKKVFNLGDLTPDGAQFDLLVDEGDELKLGNLIVRVMNTPGHTPACVSYQVGDAVFIGDTLFSPAAGSARADFPGGDAHTLYQSVSRLLSLPEDTRLFLCHDYPAPGVAPVACTTVAEQKRNNIHFQGEEMDYIKMRTARDATLDMPMLILPSIQINIRAGAFPAPENNGVSYLKLPLNQFKEA